MAVLSAGLLVVGVSDIERAVSFWCEALGYAVRRDGFGGWSTVLTPPAGSGLTIALQLSETSPDIHPRLHLDLHVSDISEQRSEVERLISIGAKRVDWDSYPADPDFVVLSDPDGNRFCVVDLSHPHD